MMKIKMPDQNKDAMSSDPKSKARDERIQALNTALMNVIIYGGHGCHWTEIPVAIGMLLKTFTNSIQMVADGKNPPGGFDPSLRGNALDDAITDEIYRRFRDGYACKVDVVFAPDSSEQGSAKAT